MSPPLQALFDQFHFTIVCQDGVFRVKKSDSLPIPDLEEKVVDFGPNPELWPHPEFLAFHNAEFKVRAATGISPFEHHDSDRALLPDSVEAREYVSEWIEHQNSEEFSEVEQV